MAQGVRDRPQPTSEPSVCLSVCHREPRAPRSTFAQPERTSHMDAPPREQRARAAFFREKEARRVAKKQCKKERPPGEGGAVCFVFRCCAATASVVQLQEVEPVEVAFASNSWAHRGKEARALHIRLLQAQRP